MNVWHRFLFVTLLVGLAPAWAPAQEAGLATNAMAPADVSSLTRDPFWPVGWVPPQAGPPTTNAPAGTSSAAALTRWDEAKKLLVVTGLSRDKDGKYLAILKGIGVVEEGDTISVNHMGMAYKWKIKSITSKGIVPEKTGAYPIK